jgi:hypothetical protein
MIEHPKQNTSIQYGEDVTLVVSAVGPQCLNYRWMKDGQEIHNAEDTEKLTIASFSSENQGKYLCIISSSQQSIESKPALLGLGT